MFMYNPIGKTLLQVAQECGPNINGWGVFVLQSKDDTVGKEVGMDFSIMTILKQYPHLANYSVKMENDFFGSTILRVFHE